MDILFVLVFFVSIICIILGLIKPKIVIRWGNDSNKTRRMVLLYYGVAMIVSIVMVATTSSTEEKVSISNSSTVEKSKAELNVLVSKYLNNDFEEKEETKYLTDIDFFEVSQINNEITNILNSSLGKREYSKIIKYIDKIQKIKKVNFNLTEIKSIVDNININIKEIKGIDQEIKSITNKIVSLEDIIYVEGYVINQVSYGDSLLGNIADEIDAEYKYGITTDRKYNSIVGYVAGKNRAILKSKTHQFEKTGPFDMYIVYTGKGDYSEGGFDVKRDEYRPASESEIDYVVNGDSYEANIRTLQSNKEQKNNKIEIFKKQFLDCLGISVNKIDDKKTESENKIKEPQKTVNRQDKIKNTVSTIDTIKYENGRFGYSIDYPKTWGKIEESDNGDGCVLFMDDAEDIRVYACYMMDNDFRSYIENFYSGWEHIEANVEGATQTVKLAYYGEDSYQTAVVAEKNGVVYTFRCTHMYIDVNPDYSEDKKEAIMKGAEIAEKTFKVF
ncbi:hypothetical protein IZY60_13915 [Lutibacter sp. B2]|nr:hypothetical protein [Lutibacter sp. B2]